MFFEVKEGLCKFISKIVTLMLMRHACTLHNAHTCKTKFAVGILLLKLYLIGSNVSIFEVRKRY